MSSGPPLLGRYHVERRLGGDDDAPLLVRDDTDPSARLVFRPIPREAVAAANRFSGASHPRLARWLGVRGSALDGWFMVSEFVAGVDFAVALPELSRRHALAVLRDAVLGLEALHRIGLTHGDFKPSNIIVDDHGRGRLIDPRLVGDPRGERGTLHYLAPERLVSGVVTPVAELFAVGVVLFEILAGHVPFRGESALEVVRSIMLGAPEREGPEDKDSLSSRGFPLARTLLAREPSLRPDSAGATLAGLEAVLRDGGGREETLPATERTTDDLVTAVLAARAVFHEADQRTLEAFLDQLEGQDNDRLDLRHPHRGIARLVVRGPCGSGRTTFLRHAEERAIARGMIFIRLQGAGQNDDPVEPLAVTLRALLGDAPSVGPTSAQGLRQLMERATLQSPLLLLSDDHDLGSRDRRSWVRALLRDEAESEGRYARRGGPRIGLIVAGAPRDIEAMLPLDAIEEGDALDLSPLTEVEVSRFLHATFTGLAAAEAFASELVRRTGGRPGRLRAALLGLASARGIDERGGVTVADLVKLRAVCEQGASSEQDGVVDARWSALGVDQQRVAAAIAVIGEPVSVATLSLGLSRPASAVADDARGLARHDLIRAEPGQDGVLRYQIAYGISADRLAARVSIATDAWACLARAALSEPYSPFARARSVGRLLRVAGRPAAARFLIRAARAAGPNEAVRLLADADRLRPRGQGDPERMALRARAAHASGQLAQAEPLLMDARAAATDAVSRRRLTLETAQLLERLGRAGDGLAILDQELLVDSGDEARAILAAKAWSLHALSRNEQAAPLLERLSALPGGAPEDDLEVAAVLAAVFDRQGRRQEARYQAVRARRLARRLGRLPRAAHFDSMLGLRDAETGRAGRGMVRVMRAVRLLEQAEDRRLLPDALSRLGVLRLRAADPVGALRAFRRAGPLFDAAGNLRGRGWAANGEGMALLDLGDPSAAIEHFARSVLDRSQAGAAHGAALAAVNLIRAHGRRGDPVGMRAAIKDARARIRVAGAEAVEADLLLALARDAGDRGRRARFRRMVDLAGAAVERFDSREHRTLVELLRGEARVLLGNGEGALAHARRARFLARDAGDGPALGRATALRAAGLLVAGRSDSSRRAYRAAALLSNDPETAAFTRFVYARAAMVALRRGNASEARAAAQLAAEAAATYAARGNVPAEEAANELATTLSAAVRRTETPLDVRRRMDALRATLEASRWINECTAVSDVLDRILDAGLRLSGAARGFLVVRHKDGALRFEAARARGGLDLRDPETQISRGIVDDVVVRGQTVVTSEARVDERFREHRSISNLELLSVLCAPLKTPTQVVGALYIDDHARIDRFDEVTREVVEALAEHAAIALEKARLIAEVEGLNSRLQEDVRTRTKERDRARHDLATVQEELAERYATRHIISEDPRMLEVLALVERVADADATVLIEGEPGTGKELIARALHYSSRRRGGRFVAINCASLPDALVEAELFGYQRGAFTGAVTDRDGLFAAADGGTLFLDEIGEMHPSVQAKLLRVLQDGEFVRVGDTVPRQTRARVVSATNRSLLQMTGLGTFREDLYWRLKVLRIEVPPLRARRKDIRLLVRHFAVRLAQQDGGAVRTFSDAAMAVLEAAPWPGNVRELESVVRALLITVDSDPIDVGDLPVELRGRGAMPEGEVVQDVVAVGAGEEDVAGGTTVSLKERMDLLERGMVQDTLRRREGNRSKAAEDLGITRRWLLKLIDKHGL